MIIEEPILMMENVRVKKWCVFVYSRMFPYLKPSENWFGSYIEAWLFSRKMLRCGDAIKIGKAGI